MLHRYGLKPGECPESWCITHPDIVRGITEAYVAAGSEIVLTNSFGANSFRLKTHGLVDKIVEFNRAATALARAAIGDKGIVAASVGPTGHFTAEEGGDLTCQQLYDAFKQQVTILADAGVDAICIETMSSLQEAIQAIKAAREHTSLPVMCSFTFEPRPRGIRTMMGVTPENAAKSSAAAGASIIGTNCGIGLAPMIDIVRQMRAACPGVPILVQANAGVPTIENGQTIFKETPEFMAALVPELLRAGANIIGGCCGTTAEHIRAIAGAVSHTRPNYAG